MKKRKKFKSCFVIKTVTYRTFNDRIYLWFYTALEKIHEINDAKNKCSLS